MITIIILLLLFNSNDSYYYNKYNIRVSNHHAFNSNNNDINRIRLYSLSSTSNSKYSNNTYLNNYIPPLSANDHRYQLSNTININTNKKNTNKKNTNKNKNKNKNKKANNTKPISIAAKRKVLELKNLMKSDMKVNDMIMMIKDILTLSLSTLEIHEFNFMVTKFILELNGYPQLRSLLSDFIDNIVVTYDHVLDIRAYSTILNSYLRYKDYKRSMDIFNFMKKKEMKLDMLCYQGGIRAASFLYPWEMTMQLLEEAYSKVDNYEDEIAEVVTTAVTNLKYMETKESSNSNLLSVESRYDLMEKANALLSWCNAYNINLTSKAIDAFISLACKHGNDDDIDKFVNVMINSNLKPTEVTFNTLLNKYAIDGKKNEAMNIVEMMRTWGYSPDIVTFNILLKLYKKIEDDDSIKETLLTMETFDIKKDDYSTSTLLQYSKKNNEMFSIIDEENDRMITPYIVANAIATSNNWQYALKLLQRAVSLNKADAAVYTAAAQSCVSQGEFDAGFRVIELMLSNNIHLNKKSFSFLLSSCLSPDLDSEICSKKLKKYIDLISVKYPKLITNEVCQTLVKGLSFRGLSSLACSLHLGPLAHTTCKSEALSMLLSEMQNSCNDNDNVEFRQSLARRSLALVALYCNSNNINNRLLLRTSHFNSVLRMLSLASMHNHCEQLYRFMSGHKNITFSNTERDDSNYEVEKLMLEENELSKKLSVLWRPGTFTIAELVRAAKETTRPVLANDVIQWAVREGAFVPEGVVSDAVSFVYRVGRTDLSLSMYRSLYSAGHVQHWHDKDHLEMDLHNFSRGMAFAAIKVAIDEAKIIAKHKINRDLIIITGRSISRGSKDNDNNDDNDDDLYGYKISNEIQRVLIEDFYPPIDSGTIPDNPGRLRIIIPNTE